MGAVRRVGVWRVMPLLVGVFLVLLLPSSALAQAGGFGTQEQIVEAEGPDQIVVTHVHVTRHEGFDRVTFEIAGDGLAGWRVAYDSNPATQGEGAAVELPGEATLAVTITNALIPPDAPEGVEPFLDDVAGPEGGVVTEIFNDSIFEGYHGFFVGVTRELPFRVQRLTDPQMVVVDIASGSPVGGVATGGGGMAGTEAPLTAWPAGFAMAAALAVGGGLAVVRRQLSGRRGSR